MATETPPVEASGLRWNIARAAHQLVREQLVVGSTGNVSARHPDGFYITPTRRTYADMRAEDLVDIRFADLQDVQPEASREWRMHAAIYERFAETNVVVHTHSVHATAWSFLGEPLEPRLEEIDYYDVGTIETTVAAPTGSDELGVAAGEALSVARAALIGGHGVIVRGRSFAEALDIARVVERQAQVAWLLKRGAA